MTPDKTSREQFAVRVVLVLFGALSLGLYLFDYRYFFYQYVPGSGKMEVIMETSKGTSAEHPFSPVFATRSGGKIEDTELIHGGRFFLGLRNKETGQFIELRSGSNGRLVHTFQVENMEEEFEFFRDHFVAYEEGGNFTIYDVRTGEVVFRLNETYRFKHKFAVQKDHILAINDDGKVAVFDRGTGNRVRYLNERKKAEVTNLLPIPGTNRVFLCKTNDVEIWDYTTGEKQQEIGYDPFHPRTVQNYPNYDAVGVSPDKNTFVGVRNEQNGQALVWDRSQERVNTHRVSFEVNDLDLTNSRLLLTGEKRIVIWDLPSGEKRRSIDIDTDYPHEPDAVFREEGSGFSVLTTRSDYFKLKKSKSSHTIFSGQGRSPLVFDRERADLVRVSGKPVVARIDVAFDVKYINAYDRSEENEIHQKISRDWQRLRLSRDGRQLLTQSKRKLRLWARSGGRFKSVWTTSLPTKNSAEHLRFISPNHILSAAHGHLYVVDREGGTVQSAVEENAKDISVSRDASCVAVHPSGDELKILSLPDLKTRTSKTFREELTAVQMSKNGKHVYLATDEGTFKSWNPASGNTKTMFSVDHRIQSIVTGPSPDRLATLNDNGRIEIWDLTNNRRLHSLRNHTFPGRTEFLQFTENGKRLMDVHEYGTVYYWHPETGNLADSTSLAGGPLMQFDALKRKNTSEGSDLLVKTLLPDDRTWYKRGTTFQFSLHQVLEGHRLSFDRKPPPDDPHQKKHVVQRNGCSVSFPEETNDYDTIEETRLVIAGVGDKKDKVQNKRFYDREGKISLYSIDTNCDLKKERSFSTDEIGITAVMGNREKIYAGDYQGRLFSYDRRTGALEQTKRMFGNDRYRAPVHEIRFGPNNKYLIVKGGVLRSRNDQKVYILNRASLETHVVFTIRNDALEGSFLVDPEHNFMIAGAPMYGRRLQFRRYPDGDLIGSLGLYADGNWLSYTPNRRFDGTEDIGMYVKWHFTDESLLKRRPLEASENRRVSLKKLLLR